MWIEIWEELHSLAAGDILVEGRKYVYKAKSGRCLFMDTNMGRITWSVRKRYFGKSRACNGAPHEERKERYVAFLRSSSLKATRRRMSWQKKEKFWTKGLWRKRQQRQCSKKEVYTALQYAGSFHCLVEEWKDCEELKPKPREKWNFVDKKSEETKRRTEWCAGANKYRCMRCGRGSKYMKMPGKCTGPKYVSFLRKWRKRHLGGHDLVQEMLGLCEAKDGTEIDELLQAGAGGHKRAPQDAKTNSGPGRWQGPWQGGKKLKD